MSKKHTARMLILIVIMMASDQLQKEGSSASHQNGLLLSHIVPNHINQQTPSQNVFFSFGNKCQISLSKSSMHTYLLESMSHRTLLHLYLSKYVWDGTAADFKYTNIQNGNILGLLSSLHLKCCSDISCVYFSSFPLSPML